MGLVVYAPQRSDGGQRIAGPPARLLARSPLDAELGLRPGLPQGIETVLELPAPRTARAGLGSVGELMDGAWDLHHGSSPLVS